MLRDDRELQRGRQVLGEVHVLMADMFPWCWCNVATRLGQ
jgi:hypothetical protein